MGIFHSLFNFPNTSELLHPGSSSPRETTLESEASLRDSAIPFIGRNLSIGWTLPHVLTLFPFSQRLKASKVNWSKSMIRTQGRSRRRSSRRISRYLFHPRTLGQEMQSRISPHPILCLIMSSISRGKQDRVVCSKAARGQVPP